MSKSYARAAELAFNSLEKANSELAALMYGSLVMQLLKDFRDVDLVNIELERLGFDTGLRMVEEFLAKTQIAGCADFAETCEVVAKVGFKVFLGVAGDLASTENSGSVCYITLPSNPLCEFMELPSTLEDLDCGQFICGVIRGALEQLQIRVKTTTTKDILKGADTNEYKIELVDILKETFFDPEES